MCRGEPHRYGGPDTGNVLTWTTVYSSNHTASHGDMDKKLKPKTNTHAHTLKHARTQIQTYKFTYTRQTGTHEFSIYTLLLSNKTDSNHKKMQIYEHTNQAIHTISDTN